MQSLISRLWLWNTTQSNHTFESMKPSGRHCLNQSEMLSEILNINSFFSFPNWSLVWFSQSNSDKYLPERMTSESKCTATKNYDSPDHRRNSWSWVISKAFCNRSPTCVSQTKITGSNNIFHVQHQKNEKTSNTHSIILANMWCWH